MKVFRNTTAHAAIIVIIIGFAGKVFGFLRELLLAKYFGTSEIVDIYLMSITIPSLLFGFLPALGAGFTPVYFTVGIKERNKFLNNILAVSVGISLICILFTMIFPDNIVDFMANGFSDSAKGYTTQFLMVTIWSVLFNTPIQIMISYLNCAEKYISSNISNLTVSIIQAVFVIIAAKIDVSLLPYGYLCPFIIQFVWLFFSSSRVGFRPTAKIDIDKNIKKIFVLVIPIFISNMLVDLNGFVDKYLASSLPEGRIAALNYAFTLRSVLFTVCTTVITTIFYPKISELVSEKKEKELSSVINRVITVLIILFVPIQFFCVIFSKDIVKLVLMRGNFSQLSLNLTVYPFIMYMCSLLFISIRDFAVKVFYAKEDSTSNLLYGAINIGVNIVISVILVKPLGHVGLALGTTLAALITLPLYLRKLRREIQGIEIKVCLINTGKIILASVVMGIFLLSSTNIINSIIPKYGNMLLLIRIIIQFICASAIYLLLLRLLHVNEILKIISNIKYLLKK